MPSRQRPPEALDAEHCDGPGPVTDSDAGSPETAKGPTSLAEAEGEVARAESRAKEARARAMRLRRQAETASSDERGTTDSADADSDTAAVDEAAGEAAPPTARSGRWRRLRWPRWVRRPGRKAVGVGAAIVLISASLGASGYMVWQHRTLVHERQRAAEFAAAARQGVVTFMSIDANHAKEDFQRVIDDSTGQLKDQLEAMAIYLVKNAEDAKVSTKATVDAVAVESMTDNSAVVLVVAKSDTTNSDKTKRPPASWRLSVDIDRDGGQLKVSKVEFLQ
jgi:Mce-associated membrane protein